MKKYIKYVLLLLAVWLAFDWVHLSGREIENVDRLDADCIVEVERLFDVEIGREGSMPITEMRVDRITLTQEQTLMLNAGSCTAQIRFVFPDGSAGATVKRSITVSDVIQKGVIEYD